jgi:cob(I)alamin adenosyltransferase
MKLKQRQRNHITLRHKSSKDHIRIESYGTVDELNSVHWPSTWSRNECAHKDILAEIQDRLFTIGAILATPQEKRGIENGELRLQNLGFSTSNF